MWKKHLERDDSRIVGEDGAFAGFNEFKCLTALFIFLLQSCSQDSCAALCTAQCAHTTPTLLMCSVICPCPFPRGALGGR